MIALEARRHIGLWAAAGHETAALPEQDERLGQNPRAAPEAQPINVNHWRGQDHAREWRAAGARLCKGDSRAHGMAKREPRGPAERFEDLFHQGVEIALKGPEIVDMAFAGIIHEAAREALPAPIEDRDIEVPAQQFADDFKIFFDEFRASRQNRDRSGASRAAAPARRPQVPIVPRRDRRDDGAGGCRIFQDRAKIHREISLLRGSPRQ